MTVIDWTGRRIMEFVGLIQEYMNQFKDDPKELELLGEYSSLSGEGLEEEANEVFDKYEEYLNSRPEPKSFWELLRENKKTDKSSNYYVGYRDGRSIQNSEEAITIWKQYRPNSTPDILEKMKNSYKILKRLRLMRQGAFRNVFKFTNYPITNIYIQTDQENVIEPISTNENGSEVNTSIKVKKVNLNKEIYFDAYQSVRWELFEDWLQDCMKDDYEILFLSYNGNPVYSKKIFGNEFGFIHECLGLGMRVIAYHPKTGDVKYFGKRPKMKPTII